VDTLYFWDGLRKIDIVLAFEDAMADNDEDEEKITKRSVFIRNLDAQGLELELEPSRVRQSKSPRGSLRFYYQILDGWIKSSKIVQILFLFYKIIQTEKIFILKLMFDTDNQGNTVPIITVSMFRCTKIDRGGAFEHTAVKNNQKSYLT
jgi:hypothetical protein